MKIAREHLPIIDICPKPVDESRTALTHLLLRRTGDDTGELVAADGFMLAVVPVTLDADDVPGLVHPDALRQAAKDCPRKVSDAIVMFVLDDIVKSVGHSCFPRTRGLTASDRYPDLARIIPRDAHIKASNQTGSQVAFNPTYLTRAHKALGGVGTVLWPTGPNSPIVVTPITGSRANGYSHFEADGLPSLPYAVVMPMHVVGGITATGNAAKAEAA